MCFKYTFGAALVLVGVAHFLNFEMFKQMVMADMGPLTFFGALFALVIPAAQVVGGALLIAGKKCDIAAWCIGGSLGLIAIGMLLKPVVGGAALGDVMPMAQNALLWLLFASVLAMLMCCKKEDCKDGSCDTKKEEAPAPAADNSGEGNGEG